MKIQPTQAISTAVLGALLLLGAGPGWALTPTEVAKLTALGAMAGDQFGRSVAVAGDTAVIGVPQDADGGSAYVFTRSGTTWTQQHRVARIQGKVDRYRGEGKTGNIRGRDRVKGDLIDKRQLHAFTDRECHNMDYPIRVIREAHVPARRCLQHARG